MTRRHHKLHLTGTHERRSAGRESDVGSGADTRFLRALLRFPLFYKILVANVVVIVLVAFGGAAVMRSTSPADGRDFALLLIGGLLVSAASNAVMLRLALSPLERLQRAAERVQAGELGAFAEVSPLADARFERLTETFNAILDNARSYRDRLRETAARALKATEEERKRIARELHDGAAQTLAALQCRLRLARGMDEERRIALLDRIGVDIGDVAEEMRRIAHGLRPTALDMLGLAPAIESHARAIADTTGIIVETDLLPAGGMLTAEAELALYRIIQEALSNVARHSAARRASIQIRVTGQQIVAAIDDDGRGFTVPTDSNGGGLGLFGMQERAGYVGGAVEIDSQPGAGTRVRVTIPLAETIAHA